MRAVIQRVISASVTVDAEVVGSVGRGLCVLVGIHKNDTRDDLELLVRRILNAKLFSSVPEADGSGGDAASTGKPWQLNVTEAGLGVLCVSQFTLYATLNKGKKPDFHSAMGSAESREFYNDFLAEMRRQYQPDRIQDGRFGAMMQVQLINDGPVTIIVDTATEVSSAPSSRNITPNASSTALSSLAEASDKALKQPKQKGPSQPKQWQPKNKPQAPAEPTAAASSSASPSLTTSPTDAPEPTTASR
ncbi:histidyl-tRNA synthetase 2 [Capsaspora owczarzaki ATCC 30864]|uniref:D-aminoacyl-tRNA deacylase n=1 Tax=Capsaspora owczarzaki (strain ATCC 30864) TaxID=595528 RepID=A0A0D2VUX0_CAPO3|nr:histidyl-tRNA synthetase 2 [Capsaspora owczarzaki ATCC 30864]KJE95192.1 histidyl-tRNA synthetase 2 [Capsaspora owczarzaki ATCC 30864]|eukprot:XP_004346343.1 histidyl-tRNA synthetase 2 [Capsaspora owczarzaki ATCC 30864]